MKFRIIALLVVFTIIFSACKKQTQQMDLGFVRAKVDGVLFEATTVGANVENGIFGFSGFRELMNGFTVSVFNFTGPGTYQVNMLNSVVMYGEGTMTNLINYAANPTLGPAEVVVTSHANNRVKGRFRFTGSGQNGITKTITDGEFDVLIRR